MLAPQLDPIDRELARVLRDVRLLGAVTPMDAATERTRLLSAYASGDVTRPRWTYERRDHAEALRRLEAMARHLEGCAEVPLATTYLRRVRELHLEGRMAANVGTPAFADLARQRFGPVTAETAKEASELARAWLALPAATNGDDRAAQQLDGGSREPIQSDGSDPRSLLSRMREEVGKERLPFTVATSRALASLAAISDRTIWVAEGRDVSVEDVERTVFHELEAHARPRVRASRMHARIFATGTARGVDEQEGFALVLETRRGFSTRGRRRELAARHVSVERMNAGATFVEVARAIIADGFPVSDALRIAERAFRGGDGESPGLGRERVYLEAFVRTESWLSERPEDEDVLTSGQIALDEIAALRPFIDPS